jgi:two-component system, chemotaxis family, protein-glutamate methylesterase/glutaminase
VIHRDAAAAGAPVRYRLVVVGASAGGLSALATMLGQLPQDFPLPVAIVQHLDPNHESLLASILSRRTALKVTDARDHEAMISGHVYVAPPGTHMMVAPGIAVHLTRSAPVHFVRPSADVLFESAARSCGPVIAVILTGTGVDGAAGAAVVRDGGGVVIAQDEATSAFFGMPHAAIDSGVVQYVLAVGDIGAALIDLTGSAPA